MAVVAFVQWSGEPAPEFARFWRAMLEECGLLNSGVVDDLEDRFNGHFTTEMHHRRMQWFVAEDDGAIVATAAAFFARRPGDISNGAMATLAGVYTLPSHRRRGIARELVRRAIAWCKQRGCDTIRLQASDAGRPLYAALGFVPGSEMVLTLR